MHTMVCSSLCSPAVDAVQLEERQRALPLPLADQLTLMLLSGDLTNCSRIEWQL